MLLFHLFLRWKKATSGPLPLLEPAFRIPHIKWFCWRGTAVCFFAHLKVTMIWFSSHLDPSFLLKFVQASLSPCQWACFHPHPHVLNIRKANRKIRSSCYRNATESNVTSLPHIWHLCFVFSGGFCLQYLKLKYLEDMEGGKKRLLFLNGRW